MKMLIQGKTPIIWLAGLALIGLSCGIVQAQPQDIQTLFRSLAVGEPVSYENLTVIPVYGSAIIDRSIYTTLDEALANNWLEIVEQKRASVPQVRVSNHSHNYVFLMGGEIISGGRQDRVIARDVLLAPRVRHVNVPVYCTEQNRWNQQTARFYSKKNLGTWRIRATSQYSPAGAQTSIWSDISTSLRNLGVRSSTGAYQSAYEQKGVRDEIRRHEQYLSAVPRLRGDAVGVVIAVGPNIISADIFGSPQLFRGLWPKILKSAALSAINDRRAGRIDPQAAVAFLNCVYRADFTIQGAVNLGREYSAFDNNVNVNALAFRHNVLHLAAFPRGIGTYPIDSNYAPEQRIPVIRRQSRYLVR